MVKQKEDTVPSASENLLKLPEFAYHRDTTTNRVVRLKRGEEGFYTFYTDKTAEELNRIAGVTPAQAGAMLAGSMFGWHTKAANPDNYDANGQFKKEAGYA